MNYGPMPFRITRNVLLAVCLAVILLIFPAVAQADDPPPSPTDPQTCALCHRIEVQDWLSSPHAGATTTIEKSTMHCSAGEDCTCLSCHSTNFSTLTGSYDHTGVTCEACHGKLAEGHPEEQEMVLSVDSSVCSKCHAETFRDWQTTPHAEAGVQCIGCHRSHSQNLRMDDATLCRSCHREQLEDQGHLVHLRSGLDCVSCHVVPTHDAQTTEGPSSPAHQFAVATAVCADCHGDDFHTDENSLMSLPTQSPAAGVVQAAAALPAPSADATAQQVVKQIETGKRIAQASAISLGVGLGIGGLAGILFTVIVALLAQRPWRTKS